jgi:hypothetical protein
MNYGSNRLLQVDVIAAYIAAVGRAATTANGGGGMTGHDWRLSRPLIPGQEDSRKKQFQS